MTGSELRAAREALGLTRAELAAAFGIEGSRPQAGIEDWEAGRRPVPPPAALAVRAMLTFGLPDRWP